MLLYLHLAQSCSVMKKQCRMLLLLSQSIRSTCGALACSLIITSCHCLCVVIENHGPVLTSFQTDQSCKSSKMKHFCRLHLTLKRGFTLNLYLGKKINSYPLCYPILHCQHPLLYVCMYHLHAWYLGDHLYRLLNNIFFTEFKSRGHNTLIVNWGN